VSGEPALAGSRRWLVTGGAGFIGSHLVHRLVELGQRVRVLDDLSSGQRTNLPQDACELMEGDVRDAAVVRRAMAGVELVLHQAGLGSVPRSLADPVRTMEVNARGTWTVLQAALEAGCERVVLASSSSVYGDSDELPHVEEHIGRPLSPYAASKRIAELAAEGLARGLGLSTVALRYFNVFGPRQDPGGPYAAVIPRWCAALIAGQPPEIHGDGRTTRDFTPVAAVVEANLRAALNADVPAGVVVNVGTGRETSLSELLATLRELCAEAGLPGAEVGARRSPVRANDRARSRADTTRARELLGLGSDTRDLDLVSGLRRTLEALLPAR